MDQLRKDHPGDSAPPTGDSAGKTASSLANAEGQQDVPPFTSPFAAIFVPLTEDLLEPVQPIQDPVERLQKERANLDANEKAVRNNLAFMFEREARRRITEAKKTHPPCTSHAPQELSSAEIANLVGSLTAPTVPGKPYHLLPETLDRIKKSAAAGAPPENAASPMPLHEQTLREVLSVTQIGADQIEKYSEVHVKSIRENLNKKIHKAEREE